MNRIHNLMKLCSFLDQIVEDETGGDKKLAMRVLDRHQKKRDITKIREKILSRARTEVWENKRGSSKWEVCTAKSRPSPSWKPIGYISLASILGGDHSAWIKMDQTIKRRRKTKTKTKTDQNDAPRLGMAVTLAN